MASRRGEVHHARHAAHQHLVALEGEDVGGGAGDAAAARGHVIPVRPHAELRVVVEDAAGDDVVVAEPRAGRVAGLRHRDALVERRRGGELAEHPPVRHVVVEDDRVAVVPGLAVPAEAGPQRVVGERAQEALSRPAVDREDQVHGLHVVVGADVPVGVRGRGTRADRGLVVVVVQALERDVRRGDHVGRPVLHDGVGDRDDRLHVPVVLAHAFHDLDFLVAGHGPHVLPLDLGERRREAHADGVEHAGPDVVHLAPGHQHRGRGGRGILVSGPGVGERNSGRGKRGEAEGKADGGSRHEILLRLKRAAVGAGKRTTGLPAAGRACYTRGSAPPYRPALPA